MELNQLTGTSTFIYENSDQLTSDGRTGRFAYGTNTFAYDGAGNRSTYGGGSWTNNGANQLTNAANVSRTFTYDRKGNMATEVVSGTTTSFAYDYEQRLITETTGSNVTNFLYDYDGTRRKTDGYGEFTQWYVFDGSLLLAEVNASDGALRRVYTAGATGQVSEHTLTGGAQDNNYHQDARGDILYYDDSSQNLLQRYAYDGWGKGVGNGGGSQSPRAALVGAQGYYRHVGTGSVDFYALGIRFYHPFLGRFLQRDPSGQRAGVNVYLYVADRPTVLTDPSGREQDAEESTPDLVSCTEQAWVRLAACLAGCAPNIGGDLVVTGVCAGVGIVAGVGTANPFVGGLAAVLCEGGFALWGAWAFKNCVADCERQHERDLKDCVGRYGGQTLQRRYLGREFQEK